MPLPETIRVKLSSESAGSIAVTPVVVVQEMPLRDIVELMLALTGKDVARIRELLLRGSLVSGASRFRWERLDAEAAAIEGMLASFPDADPSRTFQATACVRAVLRGPGVRIDIPLEVAEKRGLLQRRSFRDCLLQAAAETIPTYIDYSYKDRADRYHVRLSPQAAAHLREEASLLRYPTLAAKIRAAALDLIELYSRR